MTDTAPLHPADQAAFDRLLQAIPVWEGIDTAADALGLDANVLLHAGPPFASPMTISMPILNSACVAAVFEGLAQDFDQAEAMIKAGEILLQPAQDHSTVTPLAAVVSASMPMHRVVDLSATSNRIYAPINGGSRPAMRLGLRSLEVLGHIRWLNGPFRMINLRRLLPFPTKSRSFASGLPMLCPTRPASSPTSATGKSRTPTDTSICR